MSSLKGDYKSQLTDSCDVKTVTDFLARNGFATYTARFERFKIDGRSLKLCLESFANLNAIINNFADTQQLFALFTDALAQSKRVTSTKHTKNDIYQWNDTQLLKLRKYVAEYGITDWDNIAKRMQKNWPEIEPSLCQCKWIQLSFIIDSSSSSSISRDTLSNSDSDNTNINSKNSNDCNDSFPKIKTEPIDNLPFFPIPLPFQLKFEPLTGNYKVATIKSESTKKIGKSSAAAAAVSAAVAGAVVGGESSTDSDNSNIDSGVSSISKPVIWTDLHLKKLRKYVRKYGGTDNQWPKIAKRMRKYAKFVNAHICNQKWIEMRRLLASSSVPSSASSSASPLNLDTNISVNSGRRWQCNECRKTYATPTGLKYHKYVHSNDWPFRCNVCNRGFGSQSLLTYHMRGHTGERPFKCKVCPAAFSQRGNLTIHCRRHKNDNPLKCEECDAIFSYKTKLKDHVQMCHNGEKSYLCRHNGCNKRFTTRQLLNSHVSTHIFA